MLCTEKSDFNCNALHICIIAFICKKEKLILDMDICKTLEDTIQHNIKRKSLQQPNSLFVSQSIRLVCQYIRKYIFFALVSVAFICKDRRLAPQLDCRVCQKDLKIEVVPLEIIMFI